MTTTTHTPTPLVRLPRKFVDDHFERALATPEYVKASATHCWVRPDDPAIPELLDDARYYADQYGPDAPWLKPGARAVVAALTKAATAGDALAEAKSWKRVRAALAKIGGQS